MKKNGFLTFVFACIPGAGQMYYGYMKRGVSLITMFCLAFALSSIISVIAVVAPIVWMYSFFDTYDLIRNLVKGTPKPDALLFIGDENDLKRLAVDHNRVIGWVLVGLGVWALYDGVLEPLLSRALNALGMANAWYVTDSIPTVIVAVLLVYLGLKLLGIKGRSSAVPMEEMPPYPNNSNG